MKKILIVNSNYYEKISYNLVLNATDEVDSLRQTPWSLKKIISGFSTKKHSRT